VKALFSHATLLALLISGLLLDPIKGAQSPSDSEARLETLSRQAQEAQTGGDYQTAAARYEQILKLRPAFAEVRANLGLMQHLMGNYGEAVQTFEVALEQQPELFVPNLFLGLDLLRLNQARRALPYLARAERLNPRDEQTVLGLAQASVALRDFRKANEWYRRLAAINPKNGEAWYGSGITYLHLQQSAIERLGKLDLDSVYFRALLAESIIEQGRVDEAVKLYRELLKAHASQPCLRTALGLAEVRTGDLQAAVEEFQKDLQGSPICAEARLGLARVTIEQDRIDDALKAVDDAWRADPEFVEANAPMVWLSLSPEKVDTLEARVKQAEREHPAVAVLIAAIGRWRKEPVDVFERDSEASNDPRSSEAAHKEEGFAKHGPARFYSEGLHTQCAQALQSRLQSLPPADLALLAQCSYHSGDDRTALLASERLADLSPRDPAGWFWEAKSAQRLAVNALVRAGIVEPESDKVHLLLAEAYKDQHYAPKAEEEYRKVFQIKPDAAAAHMGLARMYFQDMKFDAAIPELQKVLTTSPADPEASYFMAEVLVYRHQYADALPYLENGLKGTPSSLPRVHALLARVYAAEGRAADAVSELKQSLSADNDGSYHYQLYLLYKKEGNREAAIAALHQSEALRKSRLAKQRALLENAP
jgi:tetratricopeptide (TPR) repeat protein